jgi:cytoskeletal protein CcmA (bactofilin family)
MAMFSRPNPSGRPDLSARKGDPNSLTIIAVGATIVGDIASEGVVKIEGVVQGTVRAGTQLLVAPGAMIRGDVFAAEVVAGGEIHGGVNADQRVEIQAGAIIVGDIRTQRIHIADGGRVNGQISMEPNEGDTAQPMRIGGLGEVSKAPPSNLGTSHSS